MQLPEPKLDITMSVAVVVTVAVAAVILVADIYLSISYLSLYSYLKRSLNRYANLLLMWWWYSLQLISNEVRVYQLAYRLTVT